MANCRTRSWAAAAEFPRFLQIEPELRNTCLSFMQVPGWSAGLMPSFDRNTVFWDLMWQRWCQSIVFQLCVARGPEFLVESCHQEHYGAAIPVPQIGELLVETGQRDFKLREQDWEAVGN